MTPTQRLLDAAQRLVAEADFRLGGILSNESKARDIPSTAYSQVKARHLASLRDALCDALAEQPAGQEPVAYMLPRDGDDCAIFREPSSFATRYSPKGWTPLYTAPQPAKREPLTDGQIAEIAATPCAVVGSYVHTFARAIEAAHGITKE